MSETNAQPEVKRDPRAEPLATGQKRGRLLDIIDQAKNIKCIRRGINEVTKSLNKNKAKLVVIAADTLPLELVLHIPEVCEDKGVPCVFVPSAEELGMAVGLARPTIAVVIGAPRREHPLYEKIENFIRELEH